MGAGLPGRGGLVPGGGAGGVAREESVRAAGAGAAQPLGAPGDGAAGCEDIPGVARSDGGANPDTVDGRGEGWGGIGGCRCSAAAGWGDDAGFVGSKVGAPGVGGLDGRRVSGVADTERV